MRSLVLTGGVLMLAAACSGTPASQTLYGSNGPPPHLAVAAIELRPNQASLTVSKTTRFVAVPKDASGNALSGRTVQWSSTDSAIATVSDSGVVKGLSVGSAGIMATSEGVSAAAALTVANAPVASVIVSIDSPSLTVGQGTQATATEKDASGNILTGRTVSFASSNPSVATISSTGYVTSVGAGTAVISATSEGVSGSATMIVSAPSPAPVASVAVSLNSASLTVGQGTQAVVTLKDASGNTLSGRAIAFASSNTSVATISATGVVTAVSAGTSVITATSEAVSGSATLTVTAAAPAPVASVSVTLNSGSLTVGQTTQAVVTLKDASGNTLGGRAITYSSGNTNVATVSSTGTVTAVAAGSTVITATSEGVSGTATVTVTPPPVASVTVTLNSSSITAGQTTQAVVTLKDANGNTLIGRAITFASSNAIVATVSGAGTVTGVSAGSAGITATSEGVSGSSTLTVTAAPVASVTVTLNSSSLTVGQSTQAVAVTKDGSGNTLTGRTITYSSSNTSVATVSGTGLVSALAAGSAVITATSEGVSGTAPLTVTSVPVASVTVTLNSNSLTVGQSTQAVVVLKDANGNTLTGRTTTYASSNTGIATVTGAGLVSAVAAGTTQIVATSEGISGSATLTVQAAPATKLAILTQPSTAAQSGAALAQQPALQLRDASNTPVNQGGLVVTAAIGSGSGGTLGGTTTATTNASGVAQFTNLTLTGSGSYTLVFTSPGLTSATSATISVSSSTGTATLTGISRDGGSTAGGVVVQLTGSGFAAGDAVTFGGTPATGVSLLNATTLQATVPPGSAGPVNVTVVHNGTPMTLPNGFTYWPAPTASVAADFESGSVSAPFSIGSITGGTATIVTTTAHTGTHSVLTQVGQSGGGAAVKYDHVQSEMMASTGWYCRFYVLIPAATLANTATSGQIKLYLSRLITGSGQPGYFMLGEGSQFNSSNNSFASRIDDGVQIVATGPVMTPDVWHEVEVYQYRDTVTHMGTSRVWYDGKLQGVAVNSLLGDDDPTATRQTMMGLVYTQLAAAYPLQVYVDDVVVANGFIDPTP